MQQVHANGYMYSVRIGANLGQGRNDVPNLGPGETVDTVRRL